MSYVWKIPIWLGRTSDLILTQRISLVLSLLNYSDSIGPDVTYSNDISGIYNDTKKIEIISTEIYFIIGKKTYSNG